MSFIPLSMLSMAAYAAFCALTAWLAATAGAAECGGLRPPAHNTPTGQTQNAGQAPARTGEGMPAGGASPGPASPATRSALLSGAAAVAAFLCIPLGSLPALAPLSFSGAAALLCLAVRPATGGGREKFTAVGGLALALGLGALYARRRGVPGDLLALDAYAAMPLPALPDWPGRALVLAGGLVVLAAISRAARRARARGAGAPAEEKSPGGPPAEQNHGATPASAWADQAWLLAALGIWTCLFMPAATAEAAGLGGIAGLVADAAHFWIKLLCLRLIVLNPQMFRPKRRGLAASA